MPIKHWPSKERPREKLLQEGAHALSDGELSAILIRNGTKAMSAVDTGRELFIQFGSWNNIMEASVEEFSQIPGLGIAKYVTLQACNEIGKRCAQELLVVNDVLKDTTTTYRYLISKMKNYKREVFGCLFLNNANHLLSFQELFRGTVDMANVHAREVVKAALDCNAVAIIAVHNHPSGVVTPSEADIKVTYYLKQALELVGVRLLDHIIVGRGGAIASFIKEGLL